MINQTVVTEETILWLALPWTYGKGGEKMRLSVFASPRLEGTGDGFWTLADPNGTRRCSFSHWPNVIDTIAFNLELKGRTLPDHAPVKPLRQWTPDLWPLLFSEHTPVDSFQNSGSAPASLPDRVASYSPKLAGDAVRNLYAQSGPSARVAPHMATLSATDDATLVCLLRRDHPDLEVARSCRLD